MNRAYLVRLPFPTPAHRTALAALACLLALAANVPAAPAEPPDGLFDVYADNRARGRPNWITADFVLLGYSMALDRAIAAFEEEVMLPECVRIVQGMSRSLWRMPGAGEAALGARGYITVLDALLTGSEISESPTAA